MNSLTYISRQFDVLASASAAAIRPAPPPPTEQTHLFQDSDGASSSITGSLYSSHKPSQSSLDSSSGGSLSRSKARAFLRGPARKRIASNMDPANIPLPPSPASSPTLLPESLSSGTEHLPSSSFGSRLPSNPPGRRRRKRKTAYNLIIRPFISIWRLILSMWLWLIGSVNPHEGSPLRHRTSSSTSQSSKGKQVIGIGHGNRPLLLSPSTREDPVDDQSDETLVDSDEENDGEDQEDLILSMSSKASSSIQRPRGRLARVPNHVLTEIGAQSPSMTTSILLPPGSGTPALDGSASSAPGPSTPSSSSANRVKLSLPSSPSSTGESRRRDRKRITPFPSRENLNLRRLKQQEDEANEAREAVEVDASLQLQSSPSSPVPSLYNPSTSSSTEWIAPERSAAPTTIVTPPSTETLTSLSSLQSPSLDNLDDGGASLFEGSSFTQQLLPNRLGNSYLITSKKGSRRTIPEQFAATLQQAEAYGGSPSSSRQGSVPRTPFHRPKTLVLDLDETLIHSTSSRSPLPTHPSSLKTGGGGNMFGDLGGLFIGGGGGGGFGGTGLFSSGLLAGAGGLLGKDKDRVRAGHMIEVVLNGRSTLYTVYKRPFVDYFLRKVSSWYTLVVFTASMQEYADPVIDWLDGGRGILGKRLFRESCTQLPNGTYAKDLKVVEPDLSSVCLLDNSPVSYSLDQANGIPIEGWYSDPSDEALLDLLPVLDSLRFTGDVRRVLGIKAF